MDMGYLKKMIEKAFAESRKKVAPNDFDKTKLALKYNPQTKEYEEAMEELERYSSL